MKRCAYLLAILLGCLSVAWGQTNDTAYADRLLFADGLYARAMYDLAVREYAALLKAYPDGASNDAATFRLAESLRQEGDLETAARFYSHVVVQFRESPFRLRAAYRRARLYMEEGNLEAALAHFEVILEAEPEPSLAASAVYYSGVVLLQMERLEDADAAFARLIETYPASSFVGYAWLKRGELLRMQWVQGRDDTDEKEEQEGDAELLAQALSFYRNARQADPDDPRLQAEVLFQMADVRFRAGQYEEASGLYRELMRSYPEDERARQARLQAAWAALRSGLYAEALALAEAALVEGTELAAEWLYIKANSQRQLLQHEAAAQTYAALLSRFPESRFGGPARYERAVSYFQAGDFEQAIEEAEKIRVDASLRADVSWLLAESYAALGRRAEAIQYYRIVVAEGKSEPRARDALYRLGHQLQQEAAYREASQFFLQLARQFPDSDQAPQAYFASGFALAEAGAYEEAVRDWLLLVQRYPEHALVEEALYQRAMGEIRLERDEDALETLHELLRRYPEGRYLADAYYWQGRLQAEAGQYEEASLALERALSAGGRDSLQRETRFQLGLVYQQLGREEAALSQWQPLLETPARKLFTPALLEWMAEQQATRQKYAEMLAAAELLARQEEPAWRQAGWVLAGRAHVARDEQTQARDAFRAGLAIDDSKTIYAGEAAWQLGLLALAQEDADAAEAYFRQASTLAAGERADAIRARALMGLGRAALQQGRRSDAARFFMSVAILYDDPDLVPESLYEAATLFEDLGRIEERQKVVAELGARYPESEWAGKARSTWQP